MGTIYNHGPVFLWGRGDVMSWGERSCKQPCREPQNCSWQTCNVSCSGYIWDGTTKPDSRVPVTEPVTAAVPQFRQNNQGLNRAQRRAKKVGQ